VLPNTSVANPAPPAQASSSGGCAAGVNVRLKAPEAWSKAIESGWPATARAYVRANVFSLPSCVCVWVGGGGAKERERRWI
jgi:hypothetical protein